MPLRVVGAHARRLTELDSVSFAKRSRFSSGFGAEGRQRDEEARDAELLEALHGPSPPIGRIHISSSRRSSGRGRCRCRRARAARASARAAPATGRREPAVACAHALEDLALAAADHDREAAGPRMALPAAPAQGTRSGARRLRRTRSCASRPSNRRSTRRGARTARRAPRNLLRASRCRRRAGSGRPTRSRGSPPAWRGHRVRLRQDVHAGAEAERLGGGRDGGERDQRVDEGRLGRDAHLAVALYGYSTRSRPARSRARRSTPTRGPAPRPAREREHRVGVGTATLMGTSPNFIWMDLSCSTSLACGSLRARGLASTHTLRREPPGPTAIRRLRLSRAVRPADGSARASRGPCRVFRIASPAGPRLPARRLPWPRPRPRPRRRRAAARSPRSARAT